MRVFVDQSKLLKGNADLTDDAQVQLKTALDEQELRRQFPEFFQPTRPSYGSSLLPYPTKPMSTKP